MVKPQHGGQQQRPTIAPIERSKLQTIITQDTPEAIQALVEEADQFGKALSRGLTTSQIRNIFGEVRAIEQEVRAIEQKVRAIEQEVRAIAQEEPVGAKKLPITVQRRLLMLKPKLAYQVGRFSNNDALRAFADTLTAAIDLIGDDARRFHAFVDLFEAILAYHRRYGGKTN